MFRKKKVVAIVPELIAIRKYTHEERADDGPIIGYELRWKVIKE